MKRELLDTLLAARAANQAVVLIRGLDTGRQFLMTAGGIWGDTNDISPPLREAARIALDRQGARSLEVDGERFLIQTLDSPVRLIIVGGVHIAQALIPMARQLGYEITLIDPRTAFANPKRFPGVAIDNRYPDKTLPGLALGGRSAVVVLSHDPKIDEPALQAAMDSPAFYIGALGSKGNHAKRKARLAERGYSDEDIARINGPIGLPLGGRSPAEIALATLAQIVQAQYQRLGQ